MSKMKNVISIVILAVLPFIGCIVYFSARTRANVMAFDPANTFGSVRLQLGLCMVILGIFMVLEFFTAKIFFGESWPRRLIAIGILLAHLVLSYFCSSLGAYYYSFAEAFGSLIILCLFIIADGIYAAYIGRSGNQQL